MARTDAVYKMLEIVDRPASPSDITELLHEVGRDDEVNPVGAALAYLHQQKRVKSLGRGQWVPAWWGEHPDPTLADDDGGAP